MLNLKPIMYDGIILHNFFKKNPQKNNFRGFFYYLCKKINMEYIANIITDTNIEINKFINVKSDIALVDITLPTLIVGWNKTKEIFPEQNILNKNINNKISWTYSKREKRYQYEKDIKDFIENIISHLEEKVNYRFFNYIIASECKKNKFIEYICNNKCSIYYNSNFLYLYSIKDSMTIGISLRDIYYIGVNVKDFIKSLNINNNIICNNIQDIGDDFYTLIKDNNIKFIPYLNYLKNTDIYY